MTPLRTSEPRLRRLIDSLASLSQLPPFYYRAEVYSPGEWLEALILTESSGNPTARRYEKHQDDPKRRDSVTDTDTLGRDDGPKEDDASYGLMQVMGYTWRGIVGAPAGTPLRYELLYQPAIGIGAGLEVLKAELKAVYRDHPHLSDGERVIRALCRYNGGPTGDVLVNGVLRRQEYVDKIGTWCAKVKADRRELGWL